MTKENSLVLLVEDGGSDAMLMAIAFERAGLPFRLAPGGEAAIAYLRGDGIHANRKLFPIPDLVFLDLNMPGTNGFEVLSWIRAQPALLKLPVQILSASSRLEDKKRASDLGADAYLTKPTTLNDLLHMVHQLAASLRLRQAQTLAAGTDKAAEGTGSHSNPATAGKFPLAEARRASAPDYPLPKSSLSWVSSARAVPRIESEKNNHKSDSNPPMAVTDIRLADFLHDLRSPLCSASGFADLLLERTASKLDPTSRMYLEAIITSHKKLTLLLEKVTVTLRTAEISSVLAS